MIEIQQSGLQDPCVDHFLGIYLDPPMFLAMLMMRQFPPSLAVGTDANGTCHVPQLHTTYSY